MLKPLHSIVLAILYVLLTLFAPQSALGSAGASPWENAPRDFSSVQIEEPEEIQLDEVRLHQVIVIIAVKTELGVTYYAYCHNDPINHVDILGLARAKVAVGKALFNYVELVARTSRKKINGRYVRIPKNAVPGTYYKPHEHVAKYKHLGAKNKTYSKGVFIDKNGKPNFTPFIKEKDYRKVHIGKITGNNSKDFKAANAKFDEFKHLGDKSPDGFTWHHHEDGYMQLVPRDIHQAVPHTGGAALARAERASIAALGFPLAVEVVRRGDADEGLEFGLAVGEDLLGWTFIRDGKAISDAILGTEAPQKVVEKKAPVRVPERKPNALNIEPIRPHSKTYGF